MAAGEPVGFFIEEALMTSLSRAGWLRGLLAIGAIYLSLVGCAHFAGIKIPVLYIYYDIPSTIYQDRVIGTLCIALASILFGISREVRKSPRFARHAVIAGLIILLGFCFNTLSSPEITASSVYWIQILGLAFYVGLLAAAYIGVARRSSE